MQLSFDNNLQGDSYVFQIATGGVQLKLGFLFCWKYQEFSLDELECL
jgi:hypothetical protein